jgi:hypothetical protein
VRHHHGLEAADERACDGGVLEAEGGLPVDQRLDLCRIEGEDDRTSGHSNDLVLAYGGGVVAFFDQAFGAHSHDTGAWEGPGAGSAVGLARAGLWVQYEGPCLVDMAVRSEQLRLSWAEGGSALRSFLEGIHLAKSCPYHAVDVRGQLKL